MPVLTKVDPNTPGGRIRMLRLSKEMTQGVLADRASCSQSAVAKYENNQLVPSTRTQDLIAEALGTRRSFLFPSEP